MDSSDLIELISKIVKIIGLILVFFAGLGVVSLIVPQSATESLEIEVTTEDSLPVNHYWVELPKDKYKMDISVIFRPYTLFLGDRNYYLVYAQGINMVNLSVIVDNIAITSWGWSDWVNEGEDSLEFILTSVENITLRFEFVLEELDKEFEANWEITVTEVDGLKKLASDFRQIILMNLILGGLALLIGYKGLDKL